MEDKNIFTELSAVNVNDHVEKKNTGKASLSYLSWTYAWAEVKKRYPDATYEVVKFENGLPYSFDPNTGYMVYTKVTIEGITHEMWLPVMDSHNDAMLAQSYEVKTKYGSYTVEKCTMFDVNKTIMRCLTKNLAMFGLGIYIYAGEDLPMDTPVEIPPETPEAKELKNSLLDWINNGTLQGSFASRAEQYMNSNNIEGMKKTIEWCKSQTA